MEERMESANLTRLGAKFAVTAIALLALLLHMVSDRTKLDTAGLVLVFIALLPWLASVISRAELPGGWKVEFQAVKTEQRRQAQEIDALKFLVANSRAFPIMVCARSCEPSAMPAARRSTSRIISRSQRGDATISVCAQRWWPRYRAPLRRRGARGGQGFSSGMK